VRSGRLVRRRDLRLMTSTEMPSFSRIFATSRAEPTGFEKVTMVQSLPSLSTFAFPMGIKKSADWASSERGKATP
jgi:hypothetical protein